MRPCLVRAVLPAVPVLALAACGDLFTGSTPRPQDRILFLSDRSAVDSSAAMLASDVFVMNADGSGVRNVTQSPQDFGYGDVSVSPDGKKIAFDAWTSSCYQIFTRNTDGTGLAQLTTSHCNFAPHWSPDGTRLAYVSSRNPTAVMVMNANGTGAVDVSTAALGGAAGCTAQAPLRVGLIGWVPGDRVMFYHHRCGVGSRYFMARADGGGVVEVDGAYAGYWSPDGSQVVSGEFGTLTIMNADGSGRRELVSGEGSFFAHADPWSPDGTRLVISGFHPQGDGTYMVNADGSGLRRIPLPVSGVGGFRGWSPGGDRLLFNLLVDGQRDVYVMNPDGTGMVNVTSSPSDDYFPRWLPAE